MLARDDFLRRTTLTNTNKHKGETMIASCHLDAMHTHYVTIQALEGDDHLHVTIHRGHEGWVLHLTTEEASVLGAMLLATADGDWEPRHD